MVVRLQSCFFLLLRMRMYFRSISLPHAIPMFPKYRIHSGYGCTLSADLVSTVAMAFTFAEYCT